jgi:hypothetical protein
MTPRPRPAWRLAAWAAAAAALALVTLAYFNPHLMRDLAGQVWACF